EWRRGTHERKMSKSVGRLAVLGCAFSLSVVIQSNITAASTASDTVRSFYQTLQYNMQNGPSLGQPGRVAKLAPVVPRCFRYSVYDATSDWEHGMGHATGPATPAGHASFRAVRHGSLR